MRDKSAALALMTKALKRCGRTEAIVTDWPKSYTAALKELGNKDRHERGRWMNNRAENPTFSSADGPGRCSGFNG